MRLSTRGGGQRNPRDFSSCTKARTRAGPFKAEEGKPHCERETFVALHEDFLPVFNQEDTSTAPEVEQLLMGGEAVT